MSTGILMRLARRAARAYVAGPELQHASGVCGTLSSRGFGSTIGYWNADHEPGIGVLRQYLMALDWNGLHGMNWFPSIKAPALGYDKVLLEELTEAARTRATPLHFDSLGPETVDRTFQALEGLAGHYGGLGCTLPGRWRRSISDADVALRLGLRVRVVKGQWADHTGPDCDPAAGFMAVTERLAGRARHVGVATHDARLARQALGCLTQAGTACELELLWGLPCDQPIGIARDLGVAVRFYVPYGHAWLPYALSQAVRRPRILLWFLRDAMSRPREAAARMPVPSTPEGPAQPGGTRVPFL